MKQVLIIGMGIILGLSLQAQKSGFYDLQAVTNQGEDFSFEQLRGKKVMIVNTATKCSLSPQCKALQELYETYKDQGFIVIAFPANNFANREPRGNPEIRKNMEKRFGTTFPVMKKISVKGRTIDPVYQWLTKKDLNGSQDSEIKWNFQKYLIDENGYIYDIIDPITKPDTQATIDWIKGN